jgi:hypothetical protein
MKSCNPWTEHVALHESVPGDGLTDRPQRTRVPFTSLQYSPKLRGHEEGCTNQYAGTGAVHHIEITF